MADISIADAKHEAAHCVVARLLNLPVAEATAALPDPHVKTLHRLVDLEKVAMVALAGLCIDSAPEAIAMDLANAKQHLGRFVRARHGVALDGGTLPPALEAEAAAALERAHAATRVLVEENEAAIGRVTELLMADVEVDQQAIDAAISAPERADAIAARLFEATQDFVECLQEVTVARGPDLEDDYARACGAIEHQQQLACAVLRKYGLVPRRENLD